MCGRIVQAKTSDYVALFDVAQVEGSGFEPSWNLKPTQDALIVLDGDKDGVRRLVPARWSLVPTWSKTLKLKFPTFNARIETAGQKPTFRASMTRRRCIFPIDGYYEWQTAGKSKTPFYVHRDEPFGLAGLYSWWHDPAASADDGWALTATVLTQDAAAPLAWLHDRMPVTIERTLVDAWLDPEADGNALTGELTRSSIETAGSLAWHEVAPLKGNGPELTAAL
ncbi:SOS response-associated peptidase [Pseudoclavibacter sp. CFCC 13796]|uniref:SOS response-associated peptidase n=1 Tax=Pseudoclavibacter sp. CFCC 13796 TaxID=2615179 RepID=UPI0013012914|nr:SOS response-associated peptidase [Pseudoclavibacter sp. CFCC 13796]KAB1661624.1 SOS response-associated peptidase [Pseudoclavibacter sp. CFCC 13796]